MPRRRRPLLSLAPPAPAPRPATARLASRSREVKKGHVHGDFMGKWMRSAGKNHGTIGVISWEHGWFFMVQFE